MNCELSGGVYRDLYGHILGLRFVLKENDDPFALPAQTGEAIPGHSIGLRPLTQWKEPFVDVYGASEILEPPHLLAVPTYLLGSQLP